MKRGENVEVYSTFTGRWTGGFVVEEAVGTPDTSGYLVRRTSDPDVLPAVIDAQQVRPAAAEPGSPS
jgi:hypothetical protein